MSEPLKPCPGCGAEPFICSHSDDTPRATLECNHCTFSAEDRDWQRREAGPATKAMLDRCQGWLRGEPSVDWPAVARAFVAEWADTAPATPAPGSPWNCCLCGEPVRIADDLKVHHLTGPKTHEAELSDEDRKTLADGLRLSD